MNSKKRLLTLALALIFVLSLAPAITPTATAAETPDTAWYDDADFGETDFTISTADQLAGLAKLVNDQTENFSNKTITLTADIDLSDYSNWTPIGINSSPFLGTFDGGGKEIAHLTVNLTGGGIKYAGLFGYIGLGGAVKDLGIVGGTVTASGGNENYVGGVAGWNAGAITGCYNTGTVTASGGNENYVGGVAGWNAGTITGCYNTGTVTASGGGSNYAGGVAGQSFGTGAITNCYNTGTVTASGGNDNIHDAGGVAGYNSGTITNCYNTGTVKASGGTDSSAGGVAGWNVGTITGCYNIGNVEASGGNSNYAGGVAGGYNNGAITGCYNTGDVTASGGYLSNYAGGVAGEKSKTGTITNCYNTGAVLASGGSSYGNYAGGVAGRNGTSAITGCYNTGDVEAGGGTYNDAGGVAGWSDSSVITDCYRWEDVVVTKGGAAVEDSDENGINGGVKTAQELLTQETYRGSGWMFDSSNWKWSAKYYPMLGFGPEEYSFPFPAPQPVPPPVTSTTYTVKFDATGGSAVASQSVTSGGKAAKPAEPVREGYEFTGWYTDADCTKPYDFSAPVRGDLTLYAGWREIETPQPELPDMFSDDNGHWAEAFINSLGAQGYVDGFGDGVFGPDRALTRAQFVQVIFNVFGDTGQYGVPFEDCDPDAWYAEALGWAYESGIIAGYSSTQFGPDDAITREQMALLITRVAERFAVTLPDTGEHAPFADDELISDYARDAVYAMQTAGIIEGKDDGNRFDPQGTLTRAELAKVLYYVLDCAGMVAEEYRV